MKADERAAADGNSRRRAGHHVVVARAMVALVMTDRANDGELIGDGPQPLHVLREAHAGDFGWNRVELAAEFDRRFGFGVKRFVVRRPAVHPNEDARFGRSLGA